MLEMLVTLLSFVKLEMLTYKFLGTYMYMSP